MLSDGRRTKIRMGLLLAAAPVGSGASPKESGVRWKTVVDQRSSSVSIPYSILKRWPDRNGLTFRTVDGRARIRLSTMTESRPGFPGQDPKGDMGLTKAECDSWPPQYSRTTDAVASYSCVLQGSVRYYLARYSRSGHVALFVTYPVDLKPTWDQYVRRMAGSLRQVERRAVH